MRLVIALTALAVSAAPTIANTMKEPPPGHATGAPVHCLPLNRLGSSERYGDRTIIFEARLHKYYRNDLPASCPNLSSPGTAIAYQVNTGQLCSGDIFQVVDTTAPGAGYGACTFGKFTPWERDKPPK